jgi:hypothetical protein
MNKKIKRKWVSALRGGNWQQCFGRLRGPGNQRCTLGVLAEVLGVNVDVYQVDLEPNFLALNEQQYDSIYLFNDDDRKSFEEIASLIEESSDLPYHEPPESNPKHGVFAGDPEWMLRDYDISTLEMKTPWELEGKTREEWETPFDGSNNGRPAFA